MGMDIQGSDSPRHSMPCSGNPKCTESGRRSPPAQKAKLGRWVLMLLIGQHVGYFIVTSVTELLVLETTNKDFPGDSVVKNLSANAGNIGDAGSIPGLGRFPGGGHDNPLQYSCLENPMDTGAWWAMVHGVAKS